MDAQAPNRRALARMQVLSMGSFLDLGSLFVHPTGLGLRGRRWHAAGLTRVSVWVSS